MIIHEGYEGLNLRRPVVTLGIFDGVHRGHRTLLDTLVLRAGEVNGESVVITFHPHPRLVLEKNKKELTFLSTMDEKKALLDKARVDHLVIIEFTAKFSTIKPSDFIEDILVGKIRTRHLIIGHDHHFGYRGEGDYETVRNYATSLGFKVEQVQGVQTEEGAISSSLIRESLLKGNLKDANKCLGYSYSLKGLVIEGRKIGRKIGFPTANINPCYKYKLIPGDGVYAVEVQLDGYRYPGMLSIGRNPTVSRSGVKRSIEVNLFNFEGDIYGKELELVFRFRLRDEIKFDNIEQLSQQMELDRMLAIRLLA
jgi:riboflavin kinase / FMN adenylyltransferase